MHMIISPLQAPHPPKRSPSPTEHTYENQKFTFHHKNHFQASGTSFIPFRTSCIMLDNGSHKKMLRGLASLKQKKHARESALKGSFLLLSRKLVLRSVRSLIPVKIILKFNK